MSLRTTSNYNQYRGNRRLAGPAIEPVTLSEAKSHARINTTADDVLIEMYIRSAREMIEEKTGLALISQQWQLTLDHWPGGSERWWDGVQQMPISELYATNRKNDVLIPRYPLLSVESVTADDVAVTVADVFIVDIEQAPGRLVIKRGATWPVILDNANAIKISYTAGYGSTTADVPATLRMAILQMVSYMYEHRGDCSGEDAYKHSGAQSIASVFKAAQL